MNKKTEIVGKIISLFQKTFHMSLRQSGSYNWSYQGHDLILDENHNASITVSRQAL